MHKLANPFESREYIKECDRTPGTCAYVEDAFVYAENYPAALSGRGLTEVRRISNYIIGFAVKERKRARRLHKGRKGTVSYHSILYVAFREPEFGRCIVYPFDMFMCMRNLDEDSTMDPDLYAIYERFVKFTTDAYYFHKKWQSAKKYEGGGYQMYCGLITVMDDRNLVNGSRCEFVRMDRVLPGLPETDHLLDISLLSACSRAVLQMGTRMYMAELDYDFHFAQEIRVQLDTILRLVESLTADELDASTLFGIISANVPPTLVESVFMSLYRCLLERTPPYVKALGAINPELKPSLNEIMTVLDELTSEGGRHE